MWELGKISNASGGEKSPKNKWLLIENKCTLVAKREIIITEGKTSNFPYFTVTEGGMQDTSYSRITDEGIFNFSYLAITEERM